jgi:hypothetical protein
VYGSYRWGRKQSDTDGPYTVPANSHDLEAEFGAAADDRRHQIVAGAVVRAWGGVLVEPSVTVASGLPFNVTTGRDDNGDTFFADRPAWAAGTNGDAVATPFGVFDLTPLPGDAIVPRNLGREGWDVNLQLALSKTLKGITVTAFADNLLNTPRLVRFNGVLTSPVFGLPNQALNARRIELTVGMGF